MKDVALTHVKHFHIKEARLIISRFLKNLMCGNLTITLAISTDLTISHFFVLANQGNIFFNKKSSGVW